MKKLVLSLSLLGLCLFAICWIRPGQVEIAIQAPTAAQVRDLAEWPLVALPALPLLGTRPVVPFGDQLPLDHQARLRVLVEQHPHPDVSQGLNGVIVNKNIVYQIYAHLDAPLTQFGLYPTTVIAQLDGPLTGLDWIPVLTINPDMLEQLATPEQVLQAMLVLYHEYKHYKQWLKQPTDSTFRATQQPDQLTAAECRTFWQNEVQAYAAECYLALSWGFPRAFDDLCPRSVDPAAFRQYMFFSLSELVPACAAVFAELAGHPHPEAFK